MLCFTIHSSHFTLRKLFLLAPLGTRLLSNYFTSFQPITTAHAAPFTLPHKAPKQHPKPSISAHQTLSATTTPQESSL
ncbi:unnamed protein product [Chondrus crispus]|uniref:Uncharacterized protein n=1 Tax=Chondrus crispus TaxID=2769 RepID=R7Q7Y0_CHOCR|nr:unnamed protein product [Chondrus crispus]CDF33570.1 unnamed protein product [Chondrus crispus]|eukprot:XP_005713373.1 unnamed protein product [Chondrus crispus]